MNPWPFIIGSYVIGAGGTAVLVAWAWATMRRAERDAEQLKGGRE